MSRDAVRRDEAPDYYFKYIDLIGAADICELLEQRTSDTLALLSGIDDARSLGTYAAGKWSIRQVVGHLVDTERLFAFRAFWFARGFDSALPSFEPDVAVQHAASDERTWSSHLREFGNVRASTLDFFRHLPAEAWTRKGTASGGTFTVRALAYIIAGHEAHHVRLLRDRYLLA